MLKMIVCFIVSSIALSSAVAQEPKGGRDVGDLPSSFIVQFTEYRFKEPLKTNQTSAEILAMTTAKDGVAEAKMVESIRMSTIGGVDSMVQFGKNANVIVGKSRTNRGETISNSRTVSVGTIVKVKISPYKDKVKLQLSYETSKLEEADKEGSIPDIYKAKIATTQLLELGKPAIVGSTTNASSSVIVATVIQN